MTAFKKVSRSTTLVLCGLVAGAVTAGGIAQAANSSANTSAAPSPTNAAAVAPGHSDHHGDRSDRSDRSDQDRGHRGGPWANRGWGGGKFGERGLGGPVLHGEYVIADPAKPGAFTTRQVQTGVLLSATATSATVKSADGFLQTWIVNATTKIRTTPGKAGRAESSPAAPPAVVTDLTIGSTVVAFGTKNTEGSFTALRVGLQHPRMKADRPTDDESDAPDATPSSAAPASPNA